MTAADQVTTGGCLCGAVRYRVTAPLERLVACHCSMCRRASGHFIAGASAPREALTVEGEVAWYDSTPGKVRRGFCPVCGSNLFWESLDKPAIDIWAGTIDGATGLTLEAHIYVADKGDYYEIADGVPQYPIVP
jgi:hypothetical protein